MTGGLRYVADPMCSWCWGFAPVLAEVEARLAPGVELRLVLGGLAPDTADPMPQDTRRAVQAAWDAVERTTGARFDRRFWERCTPRRSTHVACRAVLAVEGLAPGRGRVMFDAVQRAYYLEARNPSLPETLAELALDLVPGLGREVFLSRLDAPETRARLARDLAARDALGVTGFPALALAPAGPVLVAGWRPAEEVLAVLDAAGLLAEPPPGDGA